MAPDSSRISLRFSLLAPLNKNFAKTLQIKIETLCMMVID